jgi:membrane associated rhomboid family serine protease
MLQAPPPVPDWVPLQQLLLVATVVASLSVARRLGGDGRWGAVLRRRFVLGVPWGTLLTVLFVLLVYWVLQGGWTNPNSPLVIPFRSWSYLSPVGVLVAGFAHSSPGHITGNLIGTVVFAPVVEYAVGHYPSERGAETFTSLETNPFARVLVVPAGSLVVGFLTGLFSLGPVIGFSGVVFAYMGFAFVTRPYLAVGALVSERVVRLTYSALRNPQITREGRPAFITPWWADVAVQGHALGIFLGAVLAMALLWRREEWPNPFALWFAALVFGIEENLWAVYAPRGASEYVLFRAVGVGSMFAFATLVTAAVAASDRPVSARFDVGLRSGTGYVVVAILVALAAVAVPFGFTTVNGDLPEEAETVEVRDYTVTYVEGAPNQYVPSFEISLFGRAFSARKAAGVRSSGVVVFSEQRRLWIEAVSKNRLEFRGRAAVRVGGIGWREAVFASRNGWSLQGNSSAYKVYLQPGGGERRLAFRTDRVTASPTVAGRNVSVHPTPEGFDVLVLQGNRTVGREPIPAAFNETEVGGLMINRTEKNLFAVHDDTRVRVASEEVPRAQQEDRQEDQQ